MRSEYVSSILAVRAVEDSIRATGKYTKGAFRKQAVHPIQGGDFPSRVLPEYYEVYPTIKELSWDMAVTVAWALVWGTTPHVDVHFRYDYREDKGTITIKDGVETVKLLAKHIPNFSDTLAKVIANGHK